MLTGNQIRRTFLDFFAANGHRIVRSSSLVPTADPTLLFTNAGMNQFKDVFLGLEQREYKRATSVQKCVRAGGKHNDLENVGFTNRHHTFFEMLGNFSFGDYFKKEAIAFAWNLITSEKWLGIPADRLTFTVFGGADIAPGVVLPADTEAAGFWETVGAPRDRIVAVPGLKENFWAMGDTGPCGPSSELHYDMGPAASSLEHTDCNFGCDCGRYVEIWNLVFMQFNRDASGNVAPLPKPSIDTGAGLERIAAVLQGKISNFETDLFTPIIAAASELTGTKYGDDFKGDASLRVIADHARAAAFLICDGVSPSKDDRGYVLRKIIRRAIRHGRLLGLDQPFLFKLVDVIRDEMGDAYPELNENTERIVRVISEEERRFGRTLSVGWKLMEENFGRIIGPYSSEAKNLEEYPPNEETSKIAALPHTGQASGIRRMTALLGSAGTRVLFPGKEAFKLSDTFGVPRDFIEESCRDMGFVFDADGYEAALAEQRARSRASWKGAHKEIASPAYAKLAGTFRTEPSFYQGTSARDLHIEAIITPQGPVSELSAGAEGEIVLDRTPFYAESGGQVADRGFLWNNERTMTLAEVTGAYYPVTGLIAHRIVAKEALRVGDRVAGEADAARREHNKRNHTATHLMHAALRNILGAHVKQAGSMVGPDRLRFDFSHFAAVDPAELADIEQQVNEQIRLNSEIATDVTTLDDALASGALAFFGDRYPEQNVRVVTVSDPTQPRGFYSKELCGGIHVRRAGDIGVFKIAVEQSVAAGTRRIEALTGEGALSDYQQARQLLADVASRLHVGEAEVGSALERLTQTQKQIEKQLEAVRRKAAVANLDTLVESARTVKDVRVLTAILDGVSREGMRELVNPLRQKMGSGVVVLGTIEDGKVALLASVTPDLTKRLQAGKIVQSVAKELGGQGGGRPDLAEAGGKDTSNLKTALDHVYSLIEQMI